ncbi:hypothetical protein N7468_000057 [Penicillium chermesinum]|uniref:Major facilitator superfamily (MFS) profile domain-containing protein n=1 Tax=Penicillium chermesinum TaxID=63820 RepID=A0A9W9PJM6_9EURO|nr:uncharacterized protein N7468_000057 [Penicillium chermesinum]KAJ5248606.1 hypothetical protein N7468_000057 [Penicillium chermesinum]
MGQPDIVPQHAETIPDPSAMESGKQEFSTEDRIASLPEEHREYLLARHGTLDLDPIPDMNDADPYNWPRWRGVSMQRTSYLVSLFIAVLGGAPLLWRPLANRYGRRPIFLISLLCAMLGNIGCAESHSYATMGLCRAITAFFICPPAAMGSAVVAEMFFKKDRARCMGCWTLMVTIGVPISPFLFGFLALRISYRWIYWVLAITNAVQLLLYFVFGAETLYLREEGFPKRATTADNTLFSFRRIDPTPPALPLAYATKPCVIIPAAAYAMVFLWGGIMLTIQTSQIFPEQFGFNTQQVGLQFLGIIIGSVLGEQIGGLISDRWMLFRQKRTGEFPAAEYRLWLSYIGYALAICGVVVFCVQLQDAGEVWNITPIVGAAIAAGGNQIVTTVNITYAVDCYRPDAASVGVFITFVRQMWGFIGPFWFPQMFLNVGGAGGAGIAVALLVAVGVIPTVLVQWRGASWR